MFLAPETVPLKQCSYWLMTGIMLLMLLMDLVLGTKRRMISVSGVAGTQRSFGSRAC